MTFSFPGAQTPRARQRRHICSNPEVPSDDSDDLSMIAKEGSGSDVKAKEGGCGDGKGYDKTRRYSLFLGKV